MKFFGKAHKAPSIFCVILSEPIEASRRISPKARSRRREEKKAAARDSTFASLGTASQFDSAGAPLENDTFGVGRRTQIRKSKK